MKIKDVNFEPFTSTVSICTVNLYHLNGVHLCQFLKIMDGGISNQDLFDQLASFSKTYPELMFTAVGITDKKSELGILVHKGKVAETTDINIVEGKLEYYKYPHHFNLVNLYDMPN